MYTIIPVYKGLQIFNKALQLLTIRRTPLSFYRNRYGIVMHSFVYILKYNALHFINWKAVTVIRLFPFRVSLSSKGDDSEKCTMDKNIYKEKMCKLLGVTDYVSSITFYISRYLRMYSFSHPT